SDVCSPIYLKRLKRNTGAALSSGQPARKWRRAKLLVPTVVLVVAALVAVVFLRATRAAALTDRDVILLADPENKTGDPVFDDTLKTMLAAQLEQSPFFNLLPEVRIREQLRYMQRSPDQRVTGEVAR